MNYQQYISAKGQQGVLSFKYKGGNDSILYTHLWSPLAQFLVDYVFPNWFAPNLITSIGFITIVIVHIIYLILSPDFKQDIPPWACFLAAAAILFYQVMDNTDGKQVPSINILFSIFLIKARKTGSSSPLGMLFDHGCDTTTSWLIGLMIANILRLQNSYSTLIVILISAYIGFFFAMWSQYHTGEMRLAKINAIDEGLVLIELFFIISGYFGQSIWQNELIAKYTYGDVLALIIGISSIFSNYQFVKDVFEQKSLLIILSSLVTHAIPFFLIIVFVSTAFLSPTKILDDYWYLFLYAYGFMWSKMVGHIQLAHITGEVVNQYSISWLFACGAQILNLVSSFIADGKCFIDEILLIYLLIIFSFVSESFKRKYIQLCYVHFCYSVTRHITEILDIQVFRIKSAKSTYQHIEISTSN